MTLLAILWLILLPLPLYATDADNCLMCHRYRGLARVDKEGAYRLFYVDESIFSRGPHVRVSCRGCHVDIDTVPHNEAQPVDCLRSCHIEEPTREIIFTHAKVEETLTDSVHAPIAFDGSRQPHAEDYPTCKDCHDMPLFRPLALFKSVRAGVSDRALSRCALCHEDENFTRYFYSHVTTRLHKARDPREVVAMCSSCHADPALAERHGLSDVVTSYLESYHGKAILHGSSLTPDCLDCHAQQGSVHEMHSKSDVRSLVHTDNRPKTCSTTDCHDTAGPSLASFDVHATRNPKTHTLEFGVALFFVVMTLAILLPILTLNVLVLIRELFPSEDAEQEIEALVETAEEKAASEGGLQRFALSQRVQHAILISLFLTLCLTGFPMKFPEASWSPFIYQCFGGIVGAPIVHRIAGVALLVGFALHVFGIFYGMTRGLAQRGELRLGTWLQAARNLPMVPSWADARDIGQLVKYVLYISPKRPNYGRFSWKEKLEYLGLFWGITLLGITGILLWSESLSTHLMPGWFLNVCFLAHTYESLLAAAHILFVHLPGVLGKPGASPLSGMVLDGKVTPHVLAEEHGGEIRSWGGPGEVTS